MAAILIPDLAPQLHAYLDEVGRKPFRFGETDCAMFVANWVWRVRGADPVAAYRGYATVSDYVAILRAAGGMRRLVGGAAQLAGLIVANDPQLGDVGLVRVPVRVFRGRQVRAIVGAICVGRGLWALRGREPRIIAAELTPVAAWSLA